MLHLKSRSNIYISKLEKCISENNNDVIISIDTAMGIIELLNDVVGVSNINCNKEVDLLIPEFEVGIRTELLKKLNSKDSILVQYLHKDVIAGGKGVITPIRYIGDIFKLPVNRLDNWPIGLYMNEVTTDNQFLLKTDTFIMCFDKLPNYDVDMLIYTRSLFDCKYCIDDITIDQLMDVLSDLEDTLITLTKECYKCTA